MIFAKNKLLWALGGGFIVTASVLKQTLWTKVSKQLVDTKQQDQEIAARSLKESRELAEKYFLEPLPAEDAKIILEVTKSENLARLDGKYIRTSTPRTNPDT